MLRPQSRNDQVVDPYREASAYRGESSRMVLCGWAGPGRDMAFQGPWCFWNPMIVLEPQAAFMYWEDAPRFKPRSKLEESFWTGRRKKGAAVCMEHGGRKVTSVVVWLWRTLNPSLLPPQEELCLECEPEGTQLGSLQARWEVKPRTVHAIST